MYTTENQAAKMEICLRALVTALLASLLASDCVAQTSVTFTTLYKFKGPPEASSPAGPLAIREGGVLYGTAGGGLIMREPCSSSNCLARLVELGPKRYCATSAPSIADTVPLAVSPLAMTVLSMAPQSLPAADTSAATCFSWSRENS